MRNSLFILIQLVVTAMLVGCRPGPHQAALRLSCPDCSLVLVSVDTLRADHLGCYGYSRETSPHLDELARQGVRFASAYSASYHTAESHMSMFTAQYPSVHGVQNATAAPQAVGLDPRIQTLPERLSASGFRCAGFHGGGNVSGPYGFARGFESYKATFSDVEPAVEWLRTERARPDERFFLFFHTYRPHDPYLPDPPYNELWQPDYRGSVISDPQTFQSLLASDDFAAKRDLFWSRVDAGRSEDLEKVRALYDGEIRQTDDELGRLFAAVDALDQPVLVVLVSDHGEEFHEHGHFLHDQVFDECLHVPFIIRHPRRSAAGTVVDERVSLVDLAPTLLDILGVPPLRTAQGRSLMPRLRGEPGTTGDFILAEKVLRTDEKSGLPDLLKQALIVRDRKLIALPDGSDLYFDLAADPLESHDLSQSLPAELARLRAILDRRRSIDNELRIRLLPGAPGPKSQLDDETIRSLEALGYLH